jgi:hypothetical protein
MIDPMSSAPPTGSAAAIRRKLRAVAALVADKGATDAERGNAAALKKRLERRLEAAGEPKGDWTDNAFRLGRLARGIARSSAPHAPKGDWTDGALRLGKALRHGYKRLLSD